jgi:hypothetical protein
MPWISHNGISGLGCPAARRARSGNSADGRSAYELRSENAIEASFIVVMTLLRITPRRAAALAGATVGEKPRGDPAPGR